MRKPILMSELDKTKIPASISALVDAVLAIEKLRIASEVRQSHLARQGKEDTETDELHNRLVTLEEYVDGRIAARIKAHPAYPWFSRVKGIGRENIAKVVTLIDIEKAETVSALWRYCGFAVEDGQAEERRKGGGSLHYNARLRVLCWRLGNNLLRARGKFYEYYLQEKEKYEQRFRKESKVIVPAARLPKKEGKKYEPERMISAGHVHNMAKRKMTKLFLSMLYVVWRDELGLPVRPPYSSEKLGHNHVYKPEDFTDRLCMAGSARGNKGSKDLKGLLGKGETPLPCAALGVIGQVASR